MKELTKESAEIIAGRFRALGEPMRLRLLDILRQGERGVGELAYELEAGQANVSKHLQVLLSAGFVERHKEGVSSVYQVADPEVFKLCDIVCGTAERELNQKRRVLRLTR
jgi:ArsR family transcriptional regulator